MQRDGDRVVYRGNSRVAPIGKVEEFLELLDE
jgi:hypothetical protein